MARRLKSMTVLEGGQGAAADPRVHAALSASAGTGKTHVLTARVFRLLLGGVSPSAILCLTFTKAGAAEMANRVAERLAYWVRLPDVELAAELRALGEPYGPIERQRARRLFARVLEAPGGLRIQTIHSFAQSLLASFPAEAGVVPGFRSIEGRAEQILARQTLAELLASAEAGGDAGLLADVERLSLRLGEGGAEDYLMGCARVPEALAAVDPATIERALRALVGLGDGDPAALQAEWVADEAVDRILFDRLIATNHAWPTATGRGIVERLTHFLHAGVADRLALLDDLSTKLVRVDGEPCRATSGQSAIDPSYGEAALDFARWYGEVASIPRKAALASIQAAGLRAGKAFADAYVRAKRAAGVADFDDLIRWTRGLLAQPGMGQWVRFKLDQRTDHVLVDEAQDSNADQWTIVGALVDEFFAGTLGEHGPDAEEKWRTLFMVGDYKQAIFGFQGTNPREYEAFRRRIADRVAALDQSAADADQRIRIFRDLSIDASFRSAAPILELVDRLIADLGYRAMGLETPPNPHRAARRFGGEVILLPPFAPDVAGEDEEAGEEGWIAEPVRLYADALAARIRAWLDQAPLLASTGRPLAAGDVLVLVRSRSELAALIVARLHAHGVAVAGIDRLHLSKPLAVRDLLAAVGFAVQPHDDLNLGGLLVSPLIGFDQDLLYRLAHRRQGSLWDALRARAHEEPGFADAHQRLAAILASADYVPPSRFLETILSGPLDGRRRLLARLGEAARDPIEELVTAAHEFEGEDSPSLDRFLDWFGKGEVEVKRDPAAAGDAVRVMTVHGSKGLEAPLVVLADATHDPAKVGRRPVAMQVTDRPDLPPLLRPRKDERFAPFDLLLEREKAAALEEHWRLLYVALTRAKERLVVAGVRPSKALSADSWHVRVEAALGGLGADPLVEPGWGVGQSWRGKGGEAARPARARRVLDPIGLPDWLRRPAPQEERPPRPLAPSALAEDREALPPPSPELQRAARRGVLLHALFERLPGVAAGDRRALAARWLDRQGVAAGERDEIVTAALVVLDDPVFADLFGPGSLAEAPIAATLADGRVIAGTVDRLCVGDRLVRVIDYKTGRAAPRDAGEVPASHRLQMAAYVDALKVIFPTRRVAAALLYTAAPRLIALDD